ncbi:CBS domain-containing protein [Aliiglaciecola lipolytica]|uniref:CBS domain protein n=1 Tax=Aliiglaciecola lipolytica E3 TaxID=1127673 RepID=K6WX33_9ALTE|nr:CBS domain-containing protein [Aliiglaciecola lipolytica]GAC13009.1 CBS domain protein [Aliiglaciecola lipolytica E3]
MITASVIECMNRDFAKIYAEMPVAEASANLIKKESLGGPVIDANGKLVGWISEQECLQVTLQVVYHNTRVAIVRDVMRTDVLTVSVDSDPLEIAQQMLKSKPKSYPVVDASGKVYGVLTRRRILNMLDKKLRELGQS